MAWTSRGRAVAVSGAMTAAVLAAAVPNGAAAAVPNGAAAAVPNGAAAAVPNGAAAAVPNDSTEPVFRAESVTFTPSEATVSGFDTVAVKVTVVGGYDRPVDEADLWVPLTSTRPVNVWGSGWSITARRVSGSAQRGTWVGEVRVPSTAASPLTVARVFPASCQWDTMSACAGSPVTPVSIRLVTRHVPMLSTAVRPSPLPVSRSSYDVVGRLLDQETKRPYPRTARVGLAFDTDCAGTTMRVARFVAATDRNGYFRIRVTNSLTRSIYSGDSREQPKGQSHCVLLGQGLSKTSTQVIAREWVRVVLQPTITAKPAANVVRTGRAVAVNGYTQDTTRQVLLQRKVGRTTWRTVGTAPARLNGRFTLSATPPAKGRNLYRAYQPANGDVLAAASAPFLLTAR